MTAETENMLRRFAENDWFANCGKPLKSEDAIQLVKTWPEATKLFKKKHSENAQLESANMLTEQLSFKAPERDQRWNTIAFALNPFVDDIVDNKVMKNKAGFKLGEHTRIHVGFDLRGTCMELEYADIVPPKHFAERAKWYLAGHFPCGWDGDFPEGRLIVF